MAVLESILDRRRLILTLALLVLVSAPAAAQLELHGFVEAAGGELNEQYLGHVHKVADDWADAAVASLVLCSIEDPDASLAEMARAVRPGGVVACLEITQPTSRVGRLVSVWFDNIVPFIGRVIGQGDAYAYLARSVQGYPGPERIAEIMREAGLVQVDWHGFLGGIVGGLLAGGLVLAGTTVWHLSPTGFALANAGISLEFGSLGDALTHPVMLGVLLGLVLGKFIGITGTCWLMLKSGMAVLPKDTRFSQIAGVSLLAGIGFTMSIFVAQLGFGESEDLLLMAKTGILAASLLAGIAGFIWLYLVSKPVEAAH